MQKNRTEITLCSLFVMLTVIMILTFINYNYSRSHLSILYVQAEEFENNNKTIGEEEEEKINKLTVTDPDWTKKLLGIPIEDNNNKNSTTTTPIPQIYPTSINGSTYKFNNTNPSDKIQVDETEDKNIFSKRNSDGSWRIDDGKPRIKIFTKDAGRLTNKEILEKNMSKSIIQSWNYSKLKKIGYWYKPSDWKNIEFTVIFKLLDSLRSKGEQHAISLVTRSISHSVLEEKSNDDDPPFYCGGSSYHNNLSNEGQVRMKKEQYHINYEWERYNPDTDLQLGNIYNKIIGFKGIVYNINDTAVKLETWLDTENEGKGPYKKVHEMIDNGNWGDSMKTCGAKTDGQAITWGSPMVLIKTNDFQFDIYNVEVREIVPPSR